MFLTFRFRPTFWLVILAMIPGIVIGMIIGKALGTPPATVPCPVVHGAMIQPAAPFDPYAVTRSDCQRWPALASNPTCRGLLGTPR
jgi:hypothetical protein